MSEPRLGCYVYCVIRAGERPALQGVAGVDAAHEIELLTHANLTALMSEVGLDEFGTSALKRNLEDLGWLERTALAHNAVLLRTRTCDAVVPFRTCTIFDDRARAHEMLERRRAYFTDALNRLRGRDEWSVKMLADPQRLEAIARERQRVPAAATVLTEEAQTPGRAFFTRKKLDRGAAEEAAMVARAAAEHAHARLREHSAGARLLPPQNPRLSGRAGKMILNGAYLVDRAAIAKFAGAIEQLRQGSPDGLELILSGPFAPYNFVGAPGEP